MVRVPSGVAGDTWPPVCLKKLPDLRGTSDAAENSFEPAARFLTASSRVEYSFRSKVAASALEHVANRTERLG